MLVVNLVWEIVSPDMLLTSCHISNPTEKRAKKLHASFLEVPGELLLLTTILLTSILASSNVVISNNLTGRDVMDTSTAGILLREVARLHVHSQRELVACC